MNLIDPAERVHVLLLRHAHALSRACWATDDAERPLSPRGRQQAERLAESFGPRTVASVVTSPAVRCVATVEPLARRAGQAIEINDRLMEGTDPLDAFRLIGELVEKHDGLGDMITCSHGDVLLGIAELLVPRSIGLDVVRSVRKGGAIRVDYAQGVPVDARLVDPPHVK